MSEPSNSISYMDERSFWKKSLCGHRFPSKPLKSATVCCSSPWNGTPYFLHAFKPPLESCVLNQNETIENLGPDVMILWICIYIGILEVNICFFSSPPNQGGKKGGFDNVPSLDVDLAEGQNPWRKTQARWIFRWWNVVSFTSDWSVYPGTWRKIRRGASHAFKKENKYFCRNIFACFNQFHHIESVCRWIPSQHFAIDLDSRFFVCPPEFFGSLMLTFWRPEPSRYPFGTLFHSWKKVPTKSTMKCWCIIKGCQNPGSQQVKNLSTFMKGILY